MKLLKNLLLITVFMLFDFGAKAEIAFCNTSIYNTALNVPQGDGIIHIIQGRSEIRVEIIVDVLVKLTVLDSKQNVVFETSVIQQERRVDIDTKGYELGAYNLVATSSIGKQEVNFVIEGE